MGTLFIVATPIGNLSDISRRALDTLAAVDLVACEDTRHTLKLLNHFGIQKRLVSYHDFNEERQAGELANQIRDDGIDVALVSDAGTPVISDPGYRLVRYCREQGVSVVSIPGANAIATALAASGLPAGEFFFAGFLPSKKAARRERLDGIRGMTCTLVFYEAPHRIGEMLADLEAVLGDRVVCVCRELTKVHEEYVFGRLSQIRARVKDIGEFVVVVEGGSGHEAAGVSRPMTRDDVLRKLGMSRNELYDLFFRK